MSQCALTAFSLSNGSAADGGDRSESIATLTGTGLIMAHTHQELWLDPNGKDIINTINRAELVGVFLWLEEIMKEELLSDCTFELLTDSQVTLQSIQKAIKQLATTWLNT